MNHSEMNAKTLRTNLNHPVIDSDGHWIEYGPHMIKALKRHGGDDDAILVAASMSAHPPEISKDYTDDRIWPAPEAEAANLEEIVAVFRGAGAFGLGLK